MKLYIGWSYHWMEKIVGEKKPGALATESNELVAIFITILKKARGHE
jgi:hypothetical protein